MRVSRVRFAASIAGLGLLVAGCGSSAVQAPEPLPLGGASSVVSSSSAPGSPAPDFSGGEPDGDEADSALEPIVLPDGRVVERPGGDSGPSAKFTSQGVPLADYSGLQKSFAGSQELLSGVKLSAEQGAAWLLPASVFTVGQGRGDIGFAGFTSNGVFAAQEILEAPKATWEELLDGRAPADSAFLARDLCGQKFNEKIKLSDECVRGPIILSVSSTPVEVEGAPAVKVSFDMQVEIYERFDVGQLGETPPVARIKSTIDVVVVPDLGSGNEGGWLVWDAALGSYEVKVL